MKKTSLYLLIPIVLTGLQPSALASEFTDIEQYHNEYNAIIFAQENDIIDGYPDNTFRANTRINRAEFTKIVITAQYSKSEIDNCKNSEFSDVPPNKWYAKYICIAKNEEIIGGYSDKTFQPEKPVSFVEAAKIIVETFGYETENSQIWYEPYIKLLHEKRAIPLGIFDLGQPIHRGETIEIVYRLMNRITDKPYVGYNNGNLKNYYAREEDKYSKEELQIINFLIFENEKFSFQYPEHVTILCNPEIQDLRQKTGNQYTANGINFFLNTSIYVDNEHRSGLVFDDEQESQWYIPIKDAGIKDLKIIADSIKFK